MAAVAQGPSWPAVFHEHYAFVHAMTRRLAGPALDADDLTQEVFVVVHRRLHTLKEPERFRSWLYGICRRVVAHQRRKHRVRQALLDLVGRAARPCTETPEVQASRRDLEQRLYAALDRLSDRRREALILFALEELDGKQIAELLDIPVATVWTRLHAARKDLLAQLTKAGLGTDALLMEAPWNG